jgi:UDP-3-O-[3-hydroxymyristoyl] N-acetylglucosamine deacetylase
LLDIDFEKLKQNTIEHELRFKGRALFTGKEVSLKLKPLPENSGIVFQRIDLPNKPKILANLDNVIKSNRCTSIGCKNFSIQTVEHLLSTLNGMGIDNLLIEIDGPEVPIGDGSSNVFINLIKKTKIIDQKEHKKPLIITKPFFFVEKDVHMIALPYHEFKISSTLHYPNVDLLNHRYLSLSINPENFKKHIAFCRTFAVYEEIKPLIEKDLIKGGGLECAVVIKDNKIVNKEGVRSPNEMVGHKILDLLGDLYLIGKPLIGHIITLRSSHYTNVLFAKKMIKHLESD